MVLYSPILSCAHRACCARVVHPLALISGHDPFPSSPGCLLRLVLYPSFFFGLFLRHQCFSLEKILPIKEFTTPQGTPFFFFCDFENVLVVVGEIVSKRNGRFSTFCDIMLVSVLYKLGWGGRCCVPGDLRGGYFFFFCAFQIFVLYWYLVQLHRSTSGVPLFLLAMFPGLQAKYASRRAKGNPVHMTYCGSVG